MNILCFASDPARLTFLLRAVSGIRSHEVNLELYRNIEELYRRLCQPKDSCPLVILYPDSRGELSVIMAMREMLSDTKVILVLPDRDEDCIKIAHTLGPRFLAFADEDPGALTMIAEKICTISRVKKMRASNE